jgi:SSS family solute:Na+ symporter
MVPLVLVGLVWVVVPLYREVIGLSAYEYFEKRFGFFARLYSSLAFSLTHFSKMGTVFFLLTVGLASLSGFDPYLILWFLGLSVIVITVIGGIEAVIWADVFQGFLFIAAGLVAGLVLLFLYARFRTSATDRSKLIVGRLVVATCGVTAVLIASLYIRLGGEGVLGIVFNLYAIFSGGIVGLFLLGLLSRRSNWQGVNIAIVACAAFTAWATLTSTEMPGAGGGKQLILDLGRFNFTHHTYMLGVYSHLILFGVGYVASLFFPPGNPARNLTIHAWLDRRRETRRRACEQGAP